MPDRRIDSGRSLVILETPAREKGPAEKAFDKLVRISPPVWPGRALRMQPGDLSLSLPYGNGVYGYQRSTGSDPIRNAPPQEATGGTVYFDNDAKRSDLKALLRLLDVRMGARTHDRDYAVFLAGARRPAAESYLEQLRFVSRFGLRFMFGAINESEYDAFPNQRLSIGSAIWLFIEKREGKMGRRFRRAAPSGAVRRGRRFCSREALFRVCCRELIP